jgi:hypothetical protein
MIRAVRAVAGVAGAVLLVGATVRLANEPPTVQCADAKDEGRGRVPAAKVVARPWYGPHHVYGLFIVPNEYMDHRYIETVNVRGLGNEVLRRGKRQRQRIDDVAAGPGSYVARAYVPTRVAVWLLLTGRFGDLRSTCNWTLVFTDTASMSTSMR